MLSFGYGFVAERYRFFPYAIVDTGIKGLKALVALQDESLDDRARRDGSASTDGPEGHLVAAGAPGRSAFSSSVVSTSGWIAARGSAVSPG